MTTNIRAAAQALLNALDNYILHPGTVGGNRRKQQLRSAADETRAALAEPEPVQPAPAADAVPVVGYLSVAPGFAPTFGIDKAENYLLNDYALVKQSDHRAAMEAVRQELQQAQQQAGECSSGYQTLEREVEALRQEVRRLKSVAPAPNPPTQSGQQRTAYCAAPLKADRSAQVAEVMRMIGQYGYARSTSLSMQTAKALCDDIEAAVRKLAGEA